MSSSEPVVYVVDDDASMRRALARLLETAGRSARIFASPREFLELVPAASRGCLILDLKLPELDGLEVQRALEVAAPDLPVVFITGHGDVHSTVQAMKAGAVDFLTKPFSSEALLAAVDSAIARNAALLAERAEKAALDERLRSLTPREREVLPLVTQGLLNKQIAARLGTSLQTVKVHRSRIMAKMEAGSLADLVRMTAGLEPSIRR